MRFIVDYSKERADLSSRTDEEVMQSACELLKYYILNFEEEKLSDFLQVVGYFNAAAEKTGSFFVYELDEEKKSGSFSFKAETIPLEKNSYFMRALQLATERFHDVKVCSEDRFVTVCGTAELS